MGEIVQAVQSPAEAENLLMIVYLTEEKLRKAYVRGKIQVLMSMICRLLKMDGRNLEEVTMTEEAFCCVFKDSRVVKLLADLDIHFDGVAGLFRTFDVDRDGFVSLHETIRQIMKLREKALPRRRR